MASTDERFRPPDLLWANEWIGDAWVGSRAKLGDERSGPVALEICRSIDRAR
jgi:hypothetical protein